VAPPAQWTHWFRLVTKDREYQLFSNDYNLKELFVFCLQQIVSFKDQHERPYNAYYETSKQVTNGLKVSSAPTSTYNLAVPPQVFSGDNSYSESYQNGGGVVSNDTSSQQVEEDCESEEIRHKKSGKEELL